MAFPIVPALGIAALIAFMMRRDPAAPAPDRAAAEEEARRALAASNARAREAGFAPPRSDPRGRVILPTEGDVQRVPTPTAPPATRTAAARADLCRIAPDGLALSGSDAGTVLRTWVECDGRTSAEVRALRERIDARQHAAPATEHASWNRLRSVVLNAARSRGIEVSGFDALAALPEIRGADAPRFHPGKARRLAGELARAMRKRRASVEQFRAFQRAAAVEQTGKLDAQTHAALRHFGVRRLDDVEGAADATYTPPAAQGAA